MEPAKGLEPLTSGLRIRRCNIHHCSLESVLVKKWPIFWAFHRFCVYCRPQKSSEVQRDCITECITLVSPAALHIESFLFDATSWEIRRESLKLLLRSRKEHTMARLRTGEIV